MKKPITIEEPIKKHVPHAPSLIPRKVQDQLTIEELVKELFRDAPNLIPRKMLSKIMGETISVKYLANLDSEGTGIQPRIRIGGKVAYPKDAAIKWLKKRCHVDQQGGGNKL